LSFPEKIPSVPVGKLKIRKYDRQIDRNSGGIAADIVRMCHPQHLPSIAALRPVSGLTSLDPPPSHEIPWGD
jgi:hypothetical protein